MIYQFCLKLVKVIYVEHSSIVYSAVCVANKLLKAFEDLPSVTAVPGDWTPFSGLYRQ